MSESELVDKYLNYMNKSCRYSNHREWTRDDLAINSNTNNTVRRSCHSIIVDCTLNNYLCHMCDKNIKSYLEELGYLSDDTPYTITRGEYKNILSELKELRDTINELKTGK